MDLFDILKDEETPLQKLKLLELLQSTFLPLWPVCACLYDENGNQIHLLQNTDLQYPCNLPPFLSCIEELKKGMDEEMLFEEEFCHLILPVWFMQKFEGCLLICIQGKKDFTSRVGSSLMHFFTTKIRSLNLEREVERLRTREVHANNEIENLRMQFHEISKDNVRKNEELAEYSMKLEDMVAEKTERLEIALEKAEQASKTKSQFLANMSHEIRTPMNGIISMTELTLESEDLTQEARENLEIVKTSADNLLSIINDILDFSKIEAGKMKLEEIAFDLGEVLQNVHNSLAIKAYEKKLELIVDLSPHIPVHFLGDPGRLSQILINLVGNSIKFTEVGQITTKVQILEKNETVCTCLFEIMDTGIGIKPERIDAIFESFTQADGSTTRQYGGTGLGTTIAKQLVNLMGGEIWAESEYGKGSIFSFKIPLKHQNLKQPDFSQVFFGKEVLFGARNEALCHIFTKHLKSLGIETRTCTDSDLLIGGLVRSEQPPFALFIDESLLIENPKLPKQLYRLNLDTKNTLVLVLANRIHLDLFKQVESQIENARWIKKPASFREIEQVFLSFRREKTLQMPQKIAESPVCDSRTSSQFSGFSILVAEDNLMNQKIILKLLKEEGHEVLIAENGKIALEMSANRDFDLIFMDMMMPEMGGVEASEKIRLREKETNKHVPIVAMTANAQPEDQKRCMDAGMDAYISKPVRKKVVTDMIALYLEKKEKQVQQSQDEFVPDSYFDLSSLQNMEEQCGELVEEMVRLLKQSVETDFPVLKNGINSRDSGTVRKQILKIQDSFSFFNARGIQKKLCEMIEELNTSPFNLKSLSKKYHHLEITWKAILDTL